VIETNNIEQMLIESGGELTEAIEQALAVRDLELVEKVDGYQHIIERFFSLEAHYKERAEFFARISKQCAGVQDRLKNNLKYAMQEMGTTELIGVDVKFKLTPTSGSLVIDDADMVPVEFKSEVVETVIDKKKLKDAAASGNVPGAHVEPGFSLRMFANVPDKKKKAVSNE
jgi:hypothetical protein